MESCSCYKRGVACAACQPIVSRLDSHDKAFPQETDPMLRRTIERIWINCKRSCPNVSMDSLKESRTKGKKRTGPGTSEKKATKRSRKTEEKAEEKAEEKVAASSVAASKKALASSAAESPKSDKKWSDLVKSVNNLVVSANDAAKARRGTIPSLTVHDSASRMFEIISRVSASSVAKPRVRTVVRRMMICTHPDKNNSSKYFENFEKLTSLWNRLKQ